MKIEGTLAGEGAVPYIKHGEQVASPESQCRATYCGCVAR